MLFAFGLGGALGGMLSLPPALGVGLAYSLMWLSQSQGEAIIRTLHNATAAAAAVAPDANSDVTADHTFEEICAGPSSHKPRLGTGTDSAHSVSAAGHSRVTLSL